MCLLRGRKRRTTRRTTRTTTRRTRRRRRRRTIGIDATTNEPTVRLQRATWRLVRVL